ncbi:MAG: hypothetical protein ABSF84_02750 [Acidimicrobiales bacterium]
MDAPLLLGTILVSLGVPAVTTLVGIVMGSLLNATLTARASKRELEREDTHELLDRVRALEIEQARLQGNHNTPTERNQP